MRLAKSLLSIKDPFFKGDNYCQLSSPSTLREAHTRTTSYHLRSHSLQKKTTKWHFCILQEPSPYPLGENASHGEFERLAAANP